MTTAHRYPRRYPKLLILIATALAMLAGSAVLAAEPAAAVPVVSTAHGHRDAVDGTWLGSWRLADGTSGFCLDRSRSVPLGHDLQVTDHVDLGWYSQQDAARLAHLARTWATSTDADVAAAGQLATWQITGLHGLTAEQVSSRAGSSANRVLSLANDMLASVERDATTAVSATLALERSGTTLSLRSELTTTGLDGTQRMLEPLHAGTVTLHGGHFGDGATTATITNGQALTVTPADDAALVDIEASVTFEALPYGAGLTVARAPETVQSLLLAVPHPASASADARYTGVNPSPFQPMVTTRASHATAEPGAAVHDVLTVESDGGEWGLLGTDDGASHEPLPVLVRSRLLGPFRSAPAERPEAPADAPVVCDVQTLVDAGPGEYRTPECVLSEPGFYVWVDAIDPEDTPTDPGSDRVLPWKSAFGIAAETIQIVAPPAPPADSPPPADAAPPAEAEPTPTLAETGSTAQGLLGIGVTVLTFAALLLFAAARERNPRPKPGVVS